MSGMAARAALHRETGGFTDCWMAELEAGPLDGSITLRLVDLPWWDEATQRQGVWSAEVAFAEARAVWASGGEVFGAGRSEGPLDAATDGGVLRLDLTGSRLHRGRLEIDTFWSESIRIDFGTVEVRTLA